MNNITVNPCKYCHRMPNVVGVRGDLYYAQCRCGKWNPYEFIGTTRLHALENWNTFNLPIKEPEKPKEE